MTARPRLTIVPADPPPEVHIGDLMRADIRKRDWSPVHVRGDRSPPLDLPARVGRGWRA